MNKKQEEIAEIIIEILKNKSGVISETDLIKELSGRTKTKEVNIIVAKQGLTERKLIKIYSSSSIIITEKGWKFKSFKNLRKNKTLKKIKKNISFILNIIFLIVTIFISILNINLTGKNRELIESQLKLEEEVNRLDVQLNYPLKYQTEISPSDTIK